MSMKRVHSLVVDTSDSDSDSSDDSCCRRRPEMSLFPVGQTSLEDSHNTTNVRQRLRRVGTSKNSSQSFEPVHGPLGDSCGEGFQDLSGEDHLVHIARVQDLQQGNVDIRTTGATSMSFTALDFVVF
jgi:hypothetical protein